MMNMIAVEGVISSEESVAITTTDEIEMTEGEVVMTGVTGKNKLNSCIY